MEQFVCAGDNCAVSPAELEIRMDVRCIHLSNPPTIFQVRQRHGLAQSDLMKSAGNIPAHTNQKRSVWYVATMSAVFDQANRSFAMCHGRLPTRRLVEG